MSTELYSFSIIVFNGWNLVRILQSQPNWCFVVNVSNSSNAGQIQKVLSFSHPNLQNRWLLFPSFLFSFLLLFLSLYWVNFHLFISYLAATSILQCSVMTIRKVAIKRVIEIFVRISFFSEHRINALKRNKRNTDLDCGPFWVLICRLSQTSINHSGGIR